MCHQSISDHLANGRAEAPVAQSLLGRVLNLLSSLMGKFEGVQPDIVIKDEFDLREYGIAGKVMPTPGHSTSSISIVLDNGEALIGDLLRQERSGELGPGMFYEDRRVVIESLEKVAALEPRIIYLSHGTHIDNAALKSFIASNK